MEGIIELIDSCETMDDEERWMWKDILPQMSAPQVQKLKDILIHEKEKLWKLKEKK